MTRRKQYDWEAELKEAFRIFDMDGNGSAELTTLIPRLHNQAGSTSWLYVN